MAKAFEHSGNSPATAERRGHPRRKINEVSYIDLRDGANGGLVLDISEAGLLLQSAMKVTEEEVSRLRFQLPASDQWIEARGKLIWVSESGKEAGVQFFELSEGARASIKEWIANGASPRRQAEVSGMRTAPQQTPKEPPKPAEAPATNPATHAADSNSATDQGRPASQLGASFPNGNFGWGGFGRPAEERPPGTAQQNPDWAAPWFVQHRNVTRHPWRRLVKTLFWVTVAVVVFLGLSYYPELSRSAMLAGWKQRLISLIGYPETGQTAPSEPPTPDAAASPQAQSPGLPPSPLESEPFPANSKNGLSALTPLAPESRTSALGGMATQTLSPGIAATERNADGLHSVARTRRRSRSNLRPTHNRVPPQPGASAPSHNTVLVSAPPVGAPPARVVLGPEPVSASYFVAVTVRRSVLVPSSYNPTAELQLGKLLSHANPVYPASALAREVQGMVRVRAFIGQSGEVLSVRLLGGPAVLAPAAISAIRQWLFAPTYLNGQAIDSQADVSVYFRLH